MRKILVLCVISLVAGTVSAQWMPRAPLPAPRCAAGSGIAVANGAIFLIGETNDEYSLAGNSWSSNAPYPRPDERTNLAVAAVGNDLFFIGGTSLPSNADAASFDRYNTVSDSWLLNVGSFFPNAAAGVIAHDNRIYSFGGTSFGGATLAFRWTPGGSTIFVLLSVPTGRVKPAVVEHDGKLWVIGGTSGGNPVTAVEIFDPLFGSWSSGPALPVASAARAAGVVGGDVHVLLDAGVYRLASGSWTQVGPPPPQAGNYAAVFAGDTLHAVGGCSTEHYALAIDPVVADTTAPSILAITPSPSVITSVNHKMVPVTVTVAAIDNADPSPVARIVNVTSNEPDNGLGDGDTPVDFAITGPLTVELRGERAARRNGRIYTIVVEVADASGNVATGTTTVIVPRR